jgi:hypothetical protein
MAGHSSVAAASGIVVVVLAVGLAAAAKAETPGDWPCEQVLVPTVSAAVVWAGPAIDGLESAWRRTPEVAALVARATDQRVSDEDAEAAVEAFARALPAAEKPARLTVLFAGVLDAANVRRGEMIAGIRKLTRQQQQLAHQLDDGLTELRRLESAATLMADAAAAELRDKLAWGQRLFDDREKSLRFLCEVPVTVEERLGLLARAIAQHLE